MKCTKAFLIAIVALAISQGPSSAQDNQSVWEASGHVFSVMTYEYAGYNGYVKFWGTDRSSDAKGEVAIVRDSELTSIEALIDDVPPPSAYGIPFNTYVLWLVTPEGKLQNAGTFAMRGDKGRLHTETTLPTFGMFITAEPACDVQAPSEIVVLRNGSDNGPLRRGPAIIHYAHNYDHIAPAEN